MCRFCDFLGLLAGETVKQNGGSDTSSKITSIATKNACEKAASNSHSHFQSSSCYVNYNI